MSFALIIQKNTIAQMMSTEGGEGVTNWPHPFQPTDF